MESKKVKKCIKKVNYFSAHHPPCKSQAIPLHSPASVMNKLYLDTWQVYSRTHANNPYYLDSYNTLAVDFKFSFWNIKYYYITSYQIIRQLDLVSIEKSTGSSDLHMGTHTTS